MIKKIKEAKIILKDLGFPEKQQNDRSALTLLALCQIKPKDIWKNSVKKSMSVVGNKENAKYEGIMRFIAENYKVKYAENSRETFRRQTLHQFVQANLVEHNPENPSLPTNSKDNHYRLTDEALSVVKAFGTGQYIGQLAIFKGKYDSLVEKYSSKKKLLQIPVILSNGTKIKLSPGKHNEVQAAIVHQFAPRFAGGSEILYIGDTVKKDLYVDSNKLNLIGIPINQHGKLPDVVIFHEKKNWLFLVEAVTSHGPVSGKRIIEIEEMLKNCKAGKIYVSVFPTRSIFRKFISEIAWETEVWIVEEPDHMIHFNGDKFFGPR